MYVYVMTKPKFTRELKRAQNLLGSFPLEDLARDDFYDALQGERDEDIIYALRKIGRGGLKINYPNINSFIQERKRDREQAEQVKDTREFTPAPQEWKDLMAKIKRKRRVL